MPHQIQVLRKASLGRYVNSQGKEITCFDCGRNLVAGEEVVTNNSQSRRVYRCVPCARRYGIVD